MSPKTACYSTILQAIAALPTCSLGDPTTQLRQQRTMMDKCVGVDSVAVAPSSQWLAQDRKKVVEVLFFSGDSLMMTLGRKSKTSDN